ncbi:MAG TPA: hypothetical protein VE868_01815, partial [Balneolaceae bacterium]|nr:hypothetical protein [Balneolaceae bacterium]
MAVGSRLSLSFSRLFYRYFLVAQKIPSLQGSNSRRYLPLPIYDGLHSITFSASSRPYTSQG